MQAMRQTWAVLAGLVMGAPTAAFGQANCRNTAAFEPWLANFKKEAAAKGISQATIAAASPYLVLDQRIINIDRGQRFFAQNFLEISDKMLAGGRLPGGAAQMKKHQATFAREEKDFGVPALRHHRLLGAGKRFRRRPGQGPGDQIACHPRL